MARKASDRLSSGCTVRSGVVSRWAVAVAKHRNRSTEFIVAAAGKWLGKTARDIFSRGMAGDRWRSARGGWRASGTQLVMGHFMSDLQMSIPTTLVSSDARATLSRRAPATVQLCLVVSTSSRRAQLWVRAAHEEQWATIVCNSADDAIRQSVRQRIDLALVDLQSAPPPQERLLRKLVEQLAARRGPLLAVCGKPDDTIGEVWSRQLGVWMYLPGVDNESDIALLCGEARNVLRKLDSQTAYVAK